MDRRIESHSAPSKGVMLQIALRALRRVHLESQLFSLGQTDRGDTRVRSRRINVGAGIQTALEDTVRDAIAQEFNSSKLAHGWAMKDGARRFWIIDRQVSYKIRGMSEKKVDLEFRRVDPLAMVELRYPVGPIELKRARHFYPLLAEGSARQGALQIEAVRADVKKLCAFVRAARKGLLEKPDLRHMRLRKGEGEKIHPHLLVWGITRPGLKGGDDSSPTRFMGEVFSGLKGCKQKDLQIESMPVRWPRASRKGTPPSTIEEWVWVAYLEIAVDR